MRLNDLMGFDHVITVEYGGTVTDGPAWLHAPSLYDEELDSPQWSMLTGWSGQSGYSGPIMNNAEFIGGALAAHILDTPGHYVAIVASWSPEEGETEDLTEGWAVARYCGHSWVAGMMYVHSEDLATVASVRPVACDLCDYVPVAGRDY